MQLEVGWVECSGFLKDEQQPVEMIHRAKPEDRNEAYMHSEIYEGACWYVAGSPVFFDNRKVEWGIVQGNGNVRVPLYSYTTKAKSMEAVLATGTQIGVLGFQDIPKEKSVDKFHLAIGNVFETDAGYQVWLGLAFRMAN